VHLTNFYCSSFAHYHKMENFLLFLKLLIKPYIIMGYDVKTYYCDGSDFAFCNSRKLVILPPILLDHTPLLWRGNFLLFLNFT